MQVRAEQLPQHLARGLQPVIFSFATSRKDHPSAFSRNNSMNY